MKRIKLQKPPTDRVVEFEAPGGKVYEYKLLPLTEEVEKKLEPLTEALEETQRDENATSRDRVVAMAAQLDVMLEPLNGAPENPSEVVVKAYEANQATILTVSALIEDVVGAGRPT